MCDASAGCTSGCTAASASHPPTTTSDAEDDDWKNAAFDICDFSLSFHNLDDLNAAAGNMRTDCLAIYALETLITMFDAAYANYTSLDNGYDKEFGNYVTYIAKLVPVVLNKQFMFDQSRTTVDMGIPALGPGMSCMPKIPSFVAQTNTFL